MTTIIFRLTVQREIIVTLMEKKEDGMPIN